MITIQCPYCLSMHMLDPQVLVKSEAFTCCYCGKGILLSRLDHHKIREAVKTQENITCPRCRYRHPANRSCQEVALLAKLAAKDREEAERKEELTRFMRTEKEWEQFSRYLREVREEGFGINEARQAATRRMCLDMVAQASSVEDLKRVLTLMLEEDRKS